MIVNTLASELEVVFKAVKDITVPRYKSVFSPSLVTNMRTALRDTCAPVTHIVISRTVWAKIISDTQWHSFLDPETKQERVLAGYAGTIFGMYIVTDGFMGPEERESYGVPDNFMAVVAVHNVAIVDAVGCILE